MPSQTRIPQKLPRVWAASLQVREKKLVPSPKLRSRNPRFRSRAGSGRGPDFGVELIRTIPWPKSSALPSTAHGPVRAAGLKRVGSGAHGRDLHRRRHEGLSSCGQRRGGRPRPLPADLAAGPFSTPRNPSTRWVTRYQTRPTSLRALNRQDP